MIKEKSISILIGSLLQSLGINLFLVPLNLCDGGTIGISLILYYLFGIKVGFAAILFNIPIYILAWFRSRRYLYNSLHGMLITNFLIDVCSSFQDQPHYFFQIPNYFNAILGGIMMGTGVGLMLRYGTSTDGFELLAQLISKKVSINVGVLILIIDLCIVSIGIYFIPSSSLLYSFLSIVFAGVSTSLCTVRKIYFLNN